MEAQICLEALLVLIYFILHTADLNNHAIQTGFICRLSISNWFTLLDLQANQLPQSIKVSKIRIGKQIVRHHCLKRI